MSKEALFAWFPRLKADESFTIIDGDSPDSYNCVAYALGRTDGFWGTREDEQWPEGVGRRLGYPQHLESYIELFEQEGYERCSDPFGFLPEHAAVEPGVEKVALYVREETARRHQERFLQCPHVAKQLPSGAWSSKAVDQEVFQPQLSSLESGPDTEEAFLRAEATFPGPGDDPYSAWPPKRWGRVAMIMKRVATRR